jgi:hypothetical protein
MSEEGGDRGRLEVAQHGLQASARALAECARLRARSGCSRARATLRNHGAARATGTGSTIRRDAAGAAVVAVVVYPGRTLVTLCAAREDCGDASERNECKERVATKHAWPP